jgi:hypothetical protein
MRFFVLVFFCLLVSFAGRAQTKPEAVGTVAAAEGTVTIRRGGNPPAPAAADAAVYRNDVIETGPASKADILFADDGELTLGENAQVTVDEYVYDPDNTASGKGLLSVMRGAFTFVGGLIEKTQQPDMSLNTPYGSIGLRGTTVWGGPDDSKYGVFVSDGTVDVKTRGGKVRVPRGEGTDLSGANAVPSQPKPWQQDRIARAQSRVALKNRRQVRQHVELLKQKRRELVAQRRALRQQQQQPGQNGAGKNRQLQQDIQNKRDKMMQDREKLRNQQRQERQQLRQQRQQSRQQK